MQSTIMPAKMPFGYAWHSLGMSMIAVNNILD